ncbi:MAG: hypothetical protein ACRDSM_24135 [Pseudonocardiaceae bacterium]
MLPFVLFCEARTGSTTLMRIFNLHTEIRCLDEPFNHDYSPTYAGRVTGAESLDQVLAEIWQACNGIKHVADPSGWPFKEARLNRRMLLNPDHDLILLTRRNRLRRAISVEIAQQTGVWQPWNEEDRNRSWLFKYSPISTARLRARLNADARFLEDVNSAVRSRAGRSFVLDYEDLFGDTHGQTIVIVNKMMTFLGFDTFQSTIVPKILEIFDLYTSVTASDSQNLYRLIPNVDQVEAELGSAETGWLFKEMECRKDAN